MPEVAGQGPGHAQAHPDRGRGMRGLQAGAFVVVVVAGLKLGAGLLVPLVTATFLAIVCVPVVQWLRRRRVPTGWAVALTLVLVLGVVLGSSLIVVDSLSEFTARLPAYQERAQAMWADATGWLEERGIKLAPPEERKPLDPGTVLKTVGRVAGTAAEALSVVFLVLLLTVFLLFEAIGFPGKLRRVFRDPRADLSNFGLVAQKVYTYLGVLTFIGLLTGLLFGTWCAVLGVPFFVLWGFLAFALNYVPTIGSILSLLPPAAIALFELGVGPAVGVVAGNLAVNQVLGNVVQPRLMGERLGISPLVVFLSLVFWSWVWGPVGMLLSVPLTMVVKILLESGEDTRGLAELFGPPGKPDPLPPTTP